MRPTGALVAAPLACVLVLGAGSCSSAVHVAPAPFAADPVCARVLAALPDHVAGRASRATTAQSSRAWGDPPVVLRCGVPPPGPTTLVCQVVSGPGVPTVDWVVHDPSHGRVVWTTFGRVPAVALDLPATGTVPATATVQVARAVALTTRRASC